jgi:hypothetical protein
VFTHVSPWEVFVIADLDTLLIALYVELTDRVVPATGPRRRGPGRPPEVTDAELICLAVAQVLLRYDDERHWLRAAPHRVGHLFPRLLGQSEYNQRLKDLAPLLEAALRWLAEQVGCGQSTITAKRSGLFGNARYGYEPAPQPLLLGRQAHVDLYRRGDGHRLWPGQPKAAGRTGGRPATPGRPAGQPPAAPSSPTRAWPEQTSRRSWPT